MSVNKTTWFGVCLKIKDYKFSEEIDKKEELRVLNGQMIAPEDNIYYLIPNLKDTSRYGIYDVEYDNEKIDEISSNLIGSWSTNFINDFFPVIQEYELAYPEFKIVVAFVSVFN